MLLSKQLIKSSPSALSPVDVTLFTEAEKFPEKIIQVGEGRFVRGFVDWLINELNRHGYFKGRVVVAAPRPTGAANLARLAAQDNLYTVWLRGIEHGQKVDRKTLVSSISRCIDPYTEWNSFLRCAENPEIEIFISNTTEAGLTYIDEPYHTSGPFKSYPAKLTAYLYHRFNYFKGDHNMGMIIIPCELVDDNGYKLKELLLKYARDWDLSSSFIKWLNEANYFCNTLVDRIVAGLPNADELESAYSKLGYEDKFLTIGEPFHLWVIQDGGRLRDRWPFEKIGLNVLYVDDVTPYREQKVRILNGTHTAMTPLSLLCGCRTVYEAITDEIISHFVQRLIYDEIIPTLDMNANHMKSYANSVLERFSNPYIKHNLKDIMLNGLSKFKVRLVPTLTKYIQQYNRIPPMLTLAFAVFLLFYNAESQGADGVAVISPYYFKLDDKSLYRFYATIAGSTKLPLLIYNFPDRTAVNLSPELVLRLAQKFSNIVGIKDTVDNISHTRKLIQVVKSEVPNFSVLSGFDEYLVPNLMIGGDGVICGLTNVVPGLFSGLVKAYEARDFITTVRCQEKISILMNIYDVSQSFVAAIKTAVMLMGRKIVPMVKAPAMMMDKQGIEVIRGILAKAEVI